MYSTIMHHFSIHSLISFPLLLYPLGTIFHYIIPQTFDALDYREPCIELVPVRFVETEVQHQAEQAKTDGWDCPMSFGPLEVAWMP